jgi:hypothetical protein
MKLQSRENLKVLLLCANPSLHQQIQWHLTSRGYDVETHLDSNAGLVFLDSFFAVSGAASRLRRQAKEKSIVFLALAAQKDLPLDLKSQMDETLPLSSPQAPELISALDRILEEWRCAEIVHESHREFGSGLWSFVMQQTAACSFENKNLKLRNSLTSNCVSS